ncbi:fimbrial protein [Lelliottia sp. CFBP8978]|jgi:type 1 fimbria pilin|uniref:fimbrial protein n=1 Tax=Lelliottia sp. CFBP8978 TaxID=3096522 RepID=UPI002A6AC62D|nr:fimbrial protein [Lelliottia sp. CFBP8978]MDY1039079.1 fimbrial protein [Lelliottia sp. CFBP8978]
MSINFKSLLRLGWVFLSLSTPLSVQAATILHDCFAAPQDYHINYDRELNASENLANHDVDVPEHLVGEGTTMEANCNCPSTLLESTPITELTLAGSPLSAGANGYGYLTDKLDIDVQGYSDAIHSPDGEGLLGLSINQYPTQLSSMSKQIENIKSTEGSASVCSESTRPETSPPPKRTFRWNVIGATFHIKKPILGKEVIPPTLVVQNYACLYFNSGSCDVGSAQLVSNIWLSGSLSAPLSCTINEGSTIEVDLGNIVSKQFVSKGQAPTGYGLKNVDISYHCDDNAVGNNDRIKLTLSADQGVVDSSDPLIAKMLGRDDIGVRVYTENNDNVALDGSYEFPVKMDEQGNGSVQIKAAPVSTSNETPEPGKFEGNVTVKMDLR